MCLYVEYSVVASIVNNCTFMIYDGDQQILSFFLIRSHYSFIMKIIGEIYCDLRYTVLQNFITILIC